MHLEKLPTGGLSLNGQLSGSILLEISEDLLSDTKIMTRTSGSQSMSDVLKAISLADSTVWTLNPGEITITATKNFAKIAANGVSIKWQDSTHAVISVSISDANRATFMKAVFTDTAAEPAASVTAYLPNAAAESATSDFTFYPKGSTQTLIAELPEGKTWNIVITLKNNEVDVSHTETDSSLTSKLFAPSVYITAYPSPADYIVGQTLVPLSVTAGVSGGSVRYQWMTSDNGTDFIDAPGKTATTYAFDSSFSANEKTKYFKVKVTNVDDSGDYIITPSVTIRIFANNIVYILIDGDLTGLLPEGAPTSYSTDSITSLYNPVLKGYTGHWESAESGGSVVSKIQPDTRGTVTLYAKYSADSYLVTYDANGGQVKGTSTGSLLPSYSVSNPYTSAYPAVYSVTRAGYDLYGWYYGSTVVTLGTTKMSDTGIELAEAHTLTAIWSKGGVPEFPQAVTVTLELDGGTSSADMTGWTKDGSVYTRTVPYNTVFHYPAFASGSLTNTGFVWGVSSKYWSDGSAQLSAYSIPDTTAISSSVTYTALWTGTPQVITFTAAPEGGTVEVTVGGQSKATGDTIIAGSLVTLGLHPSSSYKVNSVLYVANGIQTQIVPVEGVYSFKMPGYATTITVMFENQGVISVWNITLDVGEHGKVTSPSTARDGTPVFLTMAPDTGYSVSSVSIDNGTVARISDTTYAISATYHAKVTVTFAQMENYYSKLLTLKTEKLKKTVGEEVSHGLRVHILPDDGLYIIKGSASLAYTYSTVEIVEEVPVLVYRSDTTDPVPVDTDITEYTGDIYLESTQDLVSVYAIYVVVEDDVKVTYVSPMTLVM